MQSELPWNVAGIPPEARDAARAAARREGLSVGEWMTRRIIRGFPEASAEERAEWPRPTLVEPASLREPEPIFAARESEEMLARVSRSEAEAQNAYKGLDQQLKTVARRLEAAERNQTENNRAMTQAATQINIAAREQAQAFEQMTSNVAALAERLVRVERHAQADNTREAVKALHEGLSRVADQIAQTASQSAAQIAALADNVDSIATQLAETRQTTDATAQATDATAQAVEARFASLDERLRVVERSAFSSASALDHTMENVETLRAIKDSLEAELRQHSTALSQVQESFEQFRAHSSIDESTRAGALANLEERFSELQSQHAENPLDLRLQGIEHVLSDIMSRLERAERSSADTSGNVEQSLRELALGFETADRQSRETVRDLQTAVEDTAAKLAAVEDKLLARIEAAVQPPAPPAPPQPQQFQPQPSEPAPPPQPILDLPPFPEFAAESSHIDFVPEPVEPFSPPEAGDPFAPASLPPLEEPAAPSDDPFANPEFADESFLAAARRSANAAAQSQDTAHASMGGFGWTLGKKQAERSGPQGKRYMLAGSIFGIAVAGALAGVVLTHGNGSPAPHAAPVPAIASPLAARPSLAHSNESDESLPERKSESSDEPAQAASAPVSNSAPQAAATAAAPPKSIVPQAAAAKLPPSDAPKPKSATAGAAGATATPVVTTNPAQAAAMPAPASPVQRLASLAKTGDPKSQLLLGLHYLEGSGVAVNEAEAARWLARAGQQGEPLAQYRLGTLYERGRGVPADAKQAAHWYELAAKQGNRKAMHNLAVAFAEGSGEPKDPAQAAAWFARAASLGLADSEFNLAVLYERGMGVKQSLTDAYKWYLIAAAQGDAESKTRAEALATQLSEGDRAAAQQAAAAFKPQPLNPAANSAPAFG